MLTRNRTEDMIALLLKEPKVLEKLSKFKHPNLQNLITWFRDSFGNIIIVIEFKEGKTLDKFVKEKTKGGKLMELETLVKIFC